MVLGRVKWFGGLNQKTGHTNNFGFLETINTELSENVYVNRRDVPSHLQYLLESGVYTQFEIAVNQRGEKRAVNVEIPLYVGVLSWYNEGRGYITCENRSDVRIEALEEFHSGDILSFYLKYNPKRRKDEALLARLIETATQDATLIKLCSTSHHPMLYRPFIGRYAATLSASSAIDFVKEKISSLDIERQQHSLFELLREEKTVLLKLTELRNLLITDRGNPSCIYYATSQYCKFIDQYIHTTDNCINVELLQELQDKLAKASETSRSSYWEHSNFLKETVEYKGSLWNLAPLDTKASLIKKRYSQFFELVSKFDNSTYPFAQSISCAWQELYQFDNTDKKLAQAWCSRQNNSSVEMARMISARGAEKLALKFFSSMGHTVEDIAAHQITKQSGLWQQADISLDSKFLLDVKNARTPVNSKVYSEFCVPKFKREQSSEVYITAVLSPYLGHHFMTGESAPRKPVSNPTILGVFSAPKLAHLEDTFNDRTISLDLNRGLDPKKYLPPWLFDYSARFYAKQDEIKQLFLQLDDLDIPDWNDILIAGSLSFSLFLATSRPLPASWKAHLPPWKLELVKLLCDLPVKNISLSHLFLVLLKHFLKMLSYEHPSYSPRCYNNLLYANSDHPLKLYDPLNIIKNFCGTLQTLWERKRDADLASFKIFQFSGRGLLRGKRFPQDSWTTILAYCGGRVEGKGKCGYSPLVLGLHDNCKDCKRLVCPEKNCRHCSNNCIAHSRRKLEEPIFSDNY